MSKDELTEAVAEWNRRERARTRANKAAEEAKAEVEESRERVKTLLGERGHEGVKAGGSLVSTYEHTRYYVVEAERSDFEKWAASQDEEYLEPNRRVREATLKDNMQELEENGQPLPPGVRKYVEVKISKRKA